FHYIDADGNVSPTSPRRRWAPRFLGLPGLIPYSEPVTPFVTFYCGSGFPMWLARTAAYERLEGWDLNLWPYEDTDMLCQFANAGVAHEIPDVLVMGRKHAEQSTNSGAKKTRHWKPGALAIMQAKWNTKENLDAEQAKVIDAACWYYRQIHLPLRSIYVA